MERNEIIYYQRKLKSQKGLVSVCEFEGFEKTVFDKEKDKNLPAGGIYSIENLGLYTYSKNNPLNVIDPDGNRPMTTDERSLCDLVFGLRGDKLTSHATSR